MSNVNLRNITNHFQDVRLASLSSWKQAFEITPRDRSGPYVILQEGFDPDDLTMTADEFVLGRSGKWLSLGHFFRLPVPERRAEFVFGTAAEVMQMMSNLPSRAEIIRPYAAPGSTPIASEDDGMAPAFKTARRKSSGVPN